MKTQEIVIEHADREEIEREIEAFRQIVIASRSSPKVEASARKSQSRLNELFKLDPTLFTVEDVRWLNVLSGYLGVRLDAHNPPSDHTQQRKRKGDSFDHCWRCQTPVDERFAKTCEVCSSKAYAWMICPICGGCGCQRSGNVLI